jgi:hypothetical protein
MAVPMMQRTLRGYRGASSGERAAFGTLSAFAMTMTTARVVNHVREQRRPSPALRSFARQISRSIGGTDSRIHHFLPGIGLAFIAGGAAIAARDDGREAWLGIPFGTGVALTLDEMTILLGYERSYWPSQYASLIQAAVAGTAAGALALSFHRRG